MTTEAQYAQALHALVEAQPSKAGAYISQLKKILEHRGHQKLANRILSELERLEQKNKRTARYAEVTEEHERTRILLELYRNLIKS